MGTETQGRTAGMIGRVTQQYQGAPTTPVFQSEDMKPRGRPMDLAGMEAARWANNGRPAINPSPQMQPPKALPSPRTMTPRTSAPAPGAALAGPKRFNKF